MGRGGGHLPLGGKGDVGKLNRPGEITRPIETRPFYKTEQKLNNALKRDPSPLSTYLLHIRHTAKQVQEVGNNEKLCSAFCPDNAHGNYCKYLPVTINGIAASALVDSGNLWRNAISEEFLHQLGLNKEDLRPLLNTKVGTASASADLEVMGETKVPLKLNMGGLTTKFKFRPIVLKDLSMHINLGGPFLKQYNIDPSSARKKRAA